jgi:hypothetical protein
LLLVPKEVFHIKKKKEKERKRQVQKKELHKKEKKNHQKCGCPLLPGLN